MEDLLAGHGYPALFLLSFLASTLIPLGSEWLLVAMLIDRQSPLTTVTIATVGNFLGACTTYWIGLFGGPFLIRRLLRIKEEDQEKAERIYGSYGSWSLLLSWLPLVGDPLCLVGGLLRIHFARFSLLVFTGKLTRYAVIAWLTLQGLELAK